MNLKTQFGPLK